MNRKILLVTILFQLLFLRAISQQNLCAGMKSGYLENATEPTIESAASDLMNRYDVKFYHLNLNIERNTSYLSGWVRTLAQFKSNADTFAFQLHSALSLDSIYAGSQKVSSIHIGNMGYAIPANTFFNGAFADLVIYYHGTPTDQASSAIGGAFTNTVDWQFGVEVTYSLSQPFSAYEWWPCKQSLQDKIDSSYVYITTDSTNKAGSNGLLKNTVAVGNKKRYEWQQIYPIDYYLISVAVAKYKDYSFYAYPVNTPPILIQNFIYDTSSVSNNLMLSFLKTKGIMELYCKLFGPYAFAAEKYGHCMTAIGGGMEHQTMTSIGSYGFEIIAHELGHQWFGDAVTCATWKDIWVNEGFATYSAYLAMQYLDTISAPQYMVNTHKAALSGADGSIWIDDTSIVKRIFDSRLSYQKGCAIIHSIRFELNNDTIFFNVLKEYIRRFKGGNAAALDFKKVLEEVSGKNFSTFFNQWFYGQGYPFFNVKWNQYGNKLRLLNIQTTSASWSIPLFITPLEYKIKTSLGDTVIRVVFQNNIHDTALFINGTVLGVEVDPNNWLVCETKVKRDFGLFPTGIGNASENQYGAYLYPNPADQRFNLIMPSSDFLSLNLIDEQGRLVKCFGEYKQAGFDCAELQSGFYILQLNTTKGNQSLRFLKN